MLSILFGIIGIAAGVLWIFAWGAWSEFISVLQGAMPPFLILVGLVAVAAGFSSMKDNAAAKKEEEKEPEEAAPAPAPAAEKPAETGSPVAPERENKEEPSI